MNTYREMFEAQLTGGRIRWATESATSGVVIDTAAKNDDVVGWVHLGSMIARRTSLFTDSTRSVMSYWATPSGRVGFGGSRRSATRDPKDAPAGCRDTGRVRLRVRALRRANEAVGRQRQIGASPEDWHPNRHPTGSRNAGNRL
jgi:hypothetical protein